uniref:NADH-ubiquinone oxidoreductase chain 2 n=1 Tax=Pidorus atratus TaxID=2015464 RepID=A0A343XA05_9NEOP|nr:NADH dehydrogenase subunit 2 [Pidorus atratus]AWI14394.1 NADH dehydrogenase subunit 2 [Pidorus atratus]
MYFTYNSNKMFFMFILFFSTLISISSNSWFGCWMGLEINLISFIPLISNSNNTMSTEASLKYFLSQSIASMNFLFMILLKMLLLKSSFHLNNFISITINMTLFLKMGAAPFHFWFPNIIEGLSWFNAFILMTWQKISPMILLSYYFNKNFMILIMIINSIIGALSGLNQTSLRKMMAFSSVHNIGWMLATIMISEKMWMLYFFMYSFLISIMCLMFNKFNLFFINQMFIFNTTPLLKIFLMINFLSLGGLPPFIGFFPKWMVINFFMMNNFFIVNFIFIMMSLILLFFYLRIILSSLMFNHLKLKWFKILFKNNLSTCFLNLLNFISILGNMVSTFFFY